MNYLSVCTIRLTARSIWTFMAILTSGQFKKQFLSLNQKILRMVALMKPAPTFFVMVSLSKARPKLESKPHSPTGIVAMLTQRISDAIEN